ncbi:MAG: D-alanyl-D-alanine carboxypeptidase/D-alanyl-D-alanine-endopeptidase [Candidatus Sericytochromatia bacterium]|nr:D-alanyl-D-alanine carboxypeptidase/D-alanyl-D-alanine-endopeptidase [Candidatus Sericytochromatia bacterium]
MSNFFSSLTLIFLSLTISLPTSAENKVKMNDNKISDVNISNLFNSAGIAKVTSSIVVSSVKTGKTLFQYNQNKPLMPASNLKLITSAAALALLKPEHRFKTVLYGDSYVSGGKLNGNLYLKGFGDPDLTSERLWHIVKKLKNTGIKEITGNLIADESFFDNKEIGEGWKVARYGDSVYSARISALSVNRNTVEVWLRSGEKRGSKAIVSLEPDNDFFKVDNHASTAGGYSRMIISRIPLPDGKNKIIVRGSIPLGSHSEVNRINLDNPALYTGYVLAKILQKEGIIIKGQVKKGITPLKAVELISTNSRTLSSIIYDLNKNSVNLIAEMLLKYLGATYRGIPGSSAKGSDVIKKEFFEKMVKVNTNNFKMFDGSGLSPLNRITTEHFVKVLNYMYKDFGVQSDYIASLPLAGADGTLRKRTKRTSGERKFRAKTGFINGVSCLSGYTFSKDGDPISFSIMMNNFSNMGSALSIQDNICTYLANNNLGN